MIYKTLHRRTDNTMVKRKRTNNDLQNIHCLSCFFWPLYCLSFSVMFCRSLFVLCLLTKGKGQTMIYKTLHRTDNTMVKRKRTNNDLQNITQKDRQYNGQKTKNNDLQNTTQDRQNSVMFCRSLFVLCLLTIVLSVLLCNVL
jgi:hypothetical protein